MDSAGTVSSVDDSGTVSSVDSVGTVSPVDPSGTVSAAGSVTVVVSSGSVHGIFPGLLYQGKTNRDLELRIISVRPWVSAAVPVRGNLDLMTPGMVFGASRRAHQNR